MTGQHIIEVPPHCALANPSAPPVLAPACQPAVAAQTDASGDAPDIAAVHLAGLSGPISSTLPGTRGFGAGFSLVVHLTVIGLVLYFAGAASTIKETAAITVELVTAAQPRTVALAPPAPPPQLGAELLPTPKVELPPPQRTLAAQLLPAPSVPLPVAPRTLAAELLPPPDLPKPANPPPLPGELLPAPRVPLPPPIMDPAGTLARFQRPPDLKSPPEQVRPRKLPAKVKPSSSPDIRRIIRGKREAERQRRARDKARRVQRNARRELARKAFKIRKAREKRRKERTEAQRRAALISETRTSRAVRSGSRRAGSSPRAASDTRRAAAAYRGIVAARLARNKPSGAVARIANGTALVAFRISSSGTATGVRLVRSAGHGALDRAAVATVRRASPFPPPPPGARRSYRVPVRFRR